MLTSDLVRASLRQGKLVPRYLAEFRSTLDVLVLPARRTERRYPRHVKIKMSNYARNRGKRTTEPILEPAEGR